MAAPALARPVFSRSSAWRRLLSARNVIVVGVAAIVAYLALVPLGFLFWQTFVRSGHLTWANFHGAYTTVGLGTMTVNSFAFAFGSTALAITPCITSASLVRAR